MTPVKRKSLPPNARLSQHFSSPLNSPENDHLADPLESSRNSEIHGTTNTTSTATGSQPDFQKQDLNNKDLLTDKEPAQVPSSKRYRIFWYWKWELAELLLAVGLLAAITSLLLHFNQQRVPDWGYTINLSTLLALLATILRALIVTVTGQIISQAKWAWYFGDRPRPLQHLQDFDSGSRGARGSALLLPKVIRGSPIAALASLVMVCSLAVGPFVQQAIKTTGCSNPVPGMTASLPAAHFVPRQSSSRDKFGDPMFYGGWDLELESAVYTSLTGRDATASQIIPDCRTGNCTFPAGDPIMAPNSTILLSMSTVGLCSLCVDISPLVGVVNRSNTADSSIWSLPNGQSITSFTSADIYPSGSFANMFTWLGSLLSPELIQASRWAVANVSSLAFSSANCGSAITPQCPVEAYFLPGQKLMAGPVASACALYPCIQRTAPSVTNNTLTEMPIDINPLAPVAYDSFGGVPSTDKSNPIFLIDNMANIQASTASEEGGFPYAAVQLPCRVNNTIYTAQNVSMARNSTTLLLYEALTNGTFQWRNVSAPEVCIYRQSSIFTSKLANFFVKPSPFLDQSCSTDGANEVGCGATKLGVETGVYNLYTYGNVTFSAVDNYFASFAQSLTSKYRTVFGSGVYNVSIGGGELPLGELRGTVWEYSVCTSADWQWLLLPAALVFLTCFLLFWTIAKNWAFRHIEPVWKDNVLPAMLYRDRFKGGNEAVLAGTAGQPLAGLTPRHGRLMEIDEMEKIAKKTLVEFQLSGNGDGEVARFSSGVEQHEMREESGRWEWLKRRKAGAVVDSKSYLLSERPI